MVKIELLGDKHTTYSGDTYYSWALLLDDVHILGDGREKTQIKCMKAASKVWEKYQQAVAKTIVPPYKEWEI